MFMNGPRLAGWRRFVDSISAGIAGSELRPDDGGYAERLTFFPDYPGYKASNPVVSDDGRFLAFQLAKSKDAAGVGHGIFVMDLKVMPQISSPSDGLRTNP
jgi:hypothetical protein